MDNYSYIVKDRQSKTKRGSIEASSREEAIKLLQGQDYFVIGISPATSSQRRKTEQGKIKKFSHSKVKLPDLAMFARQLATLLASGVTLLRSLEVVSAQCESRKLTYILQDIIADVRRGLSLTESINKYPIFTNLWRGLIDTGEASGTLSSVLDRLAIYLELRMEFMRKIVSALVYPIILFVAAGGALLFFSVFVLPKFQAIFSEFHVDLPLITLIMFNTTNFVRKNIILFILVIFALPILVKYLMNTKQGQIILDKLKLRLFFVKEFFMVFFLERCTSTFYILFDSGVPIVYAIDVVQRSIGNSVIEKMLGIVKENVKAGKSLSAEFESSEFFPPMVIEMVTIGEEVGDLPGMFSRISQHYQVAMQTKVERFTSMFEPLMIIFMGLVIGVIVVSLFLPMFELTKVAG